MRNPKTLANEMALAAESESGRAMFRALLREGASMIITLTSEDKGMNNPNPTLRRDPTYTKEQIDANPVWQLAFSLSEIQNDNAPIGWSRYIGAAICLLNLYEIKRKEPTK